MNYIEVVNYTQIQDFQSYKYFEIPLYCMFNSSNLSNDFYYCTNVDKMFKLNLTIQKAKINSSNANLGTFTIEELGYDVKPAIKTAIDNMMISNNNANVKYLYTYPSSLDGISVGTYSVSVHLISNPNICWNLYQNFSFAVKNKDNVNPNINVTNYFDYDRNITADFQQTIDMSVSFDYHKNEITIEFKENGTIIKTYTYLLEFTDKITSNGISENLDNSTFDYVVTGSNVTGSYDHYNISGVGTPTLTMNIYDSFNNKGTTEITFKIFNKNAIDNCSSSKPIISVNANSEDDIQLSGYTISANAGSIINFETSILCSDCGADCSNIAEITTTIEPQLIGLNYTELGNNMYKFDDVGTYYVTINAELSDGRKADSKILYINITRPIIVWLGEFDLPTYATQNSEVYLPYIEASQDAKVTVTVTAPGGAAPVAGDAKTTIKDGCIVWYFKTNEHTKGTYTVKYIATSKYGTITKEFRIIVGDNVAPTITIQNEENLRKDIYYDGVNKIEYIFNVEKSISNRKFVITVKSNDKDIYSYDLALNIKDKDDNGNENNNYSWSNLMYKLTGDNVNKIDDSKYTITGTGECTLTLTISDSYNNTTTKNLKFKVIEKSEQSEEIVKINTCKGYVVYTNNTGEFDIDNLNIIPGTNLTYTLVNKCIVDGILCVTTSIVTNSYGIIELSNYDNCAYIIVKVSNRGNGTELGYIQVKIYR